jgi:nicotinamide-nucleotide amidase
MERLEITTCLRRGEIEIATVFEPAAAAAYRSFETAIRERHGDVLFSVDGSTIDDQVFACSRARPARTVAVAESCTGGLMAAGSPRAGGPRPGRWAASSPTPTRSKQALAGVPGALIESHGAVSSEVAAALADGALAAFSSESGSASRVSQGRGGGTEAKPVGMVCCERRAGGGGARLDRTSICG